MREDKLGLSISADHTCDSDEQYLKSMLARLFTNLPGFAYRCKYDRDWTMEFLSDECQSVTGYTPEELIGNRDISYGKLIVKNDRDHVFQSVTSSLKTQEHFQMEYRIRKKDGSVIWVWERGLCVRSETNEPIAIEGYITEITDRKENEIKILESEQKYRELVDLSPDGIIVINTKGVIRSVNKAFTLMTGYTKEDFEQHHILKIPTAIRGNFGLYIKMFNTLINNKSDNSLYFSWKRRSGEIRLAEGRVRRVKIDNESYIMGIVRDITNLEDEKRELISRKLKAEALLNASPDIMFVLDRKGMIIDYKSEPEDLLFDDSSLISKNIYTILPENVASETKAYIEKTLKTHQMQIFNYTLEIPGKGEKHFEARMVESGKDEVTVIIRDMTDQKKMELNLIEAKEKAEENNRLKSAFLANMSHEIRTPMNALVGFTNLLSKTKDDDVRNKYIDLIKNSSDYLLHLINDVLLYSRLQSETIPVRKSVIDLGDLLRRLYDTFHLTDNKKAVELKKELDKNCSGLVILGDHEKIWEIMSIFISNAMKYTESGSVTMGVSVKDNYIKFYVKDTGIGIPEKDIDKVFERFHRAENVRTSLIGGTGLGLSIATELVDIMAGSIGLTSKVGEGSCFYFTIPLEKTELRIPDHQETFEMTVAINDFHILIAEDDDSSYLYLYELMKDCVNQIDHAWDGKEAIRMVEEQIYDLILMDMKMPLVGGVEATRAIKSAFPHIPIIAQTAFAQPEEKELILNAGADAYIVKPINKEDLQKTIALVCHVEICHE